MRVVNDCDLPGPLFRAVDVAEKPETPPDHFRVTELIDPPMVRSIKRQHDDKIIVSASTRIWALLGTIGHRIIHDHVRPEDIAEKRLNVVVNSPEGSATVTGRFDLIENVELNDWKFTTTWSLKQGFGKWGPKPEWVWQTNIYRYLAKKDLGLDIKRIRIVVLLRDWSKLEALRDPKGYPRSQVVSLTIPLYPDDKVEAYLEGRVALHLAAPRVCTPEERWAKPDVWAVKKKGNKGAMKLHSTEKDAKFMADKVENSEIEYRQGKSVRCESYCDSAPWCSFGRGVLGLDAMEEI